MPGANLEDALSKLLHTRHFRWCVRMHCSMLLPSVTRLMVDMARAAVRCSAALKDIKAHGLAQSGTMCLVQSRRQCIGFQSILFRIGCPQHASTYVMQI